MLSSLFTVVFSGIIFRIIVVAFSYVSLETCSVTNPVSLSFFFPSLPFILPLFRYFLITQPVTTFCRSMHRCTIVTMRRCGRTYTGRYV